ncbi:hypothetical protein APHAL10511_003446 [Amanita phalloides]|nr:hypothetical protein APHAL10511_003446 [Amanita phalloides]
MSELNVLLLGGSRNIGYHAAIRLLASGATVTFLLRSTTVFDKDETMQSYIQSGKARLVKGDGLVKDDVQRAWEESGRDRPVDTVLFTVGGTPKLHIMKGAVIDPPNLCTQCLLNTLTTMPKPSEANPNWPRMIVITSIGLTPSSHRSLPLLLRPVYSYLLEHPHNDKLGAERLLFHCMGRPWPNDAPEPRQDIIGPDWPNSEGLPKFGTFANILIVRPALLTDGNCMADKNQASGKVDKKPYKVGEEELSGYTISRKDVAHFVVEDALMNWDRYCGTISVVAY